jgi:ABC-type sugar transport system substrate-binding protein
LKQQLTQEMTTKRFAVIPKQRETTNPFFAIVHEGCAARANDLGVICDFEGPIHPVALDQLEIIRKKIDENVDGIAISSLDDNITQIAVQEALAKNIPIITFDSDAPFSGRLQYVGTNNFAFGETLGKILLQLKPKGGNYAIVSAISPNILERNNGVRNFLKDSEWVEIESSPSDTQDSVERALDQVEHFSKMPDLDAIIAVGGWPMYRPNTTRWEYVVSTIGKNITYVIADTLPVQIDLLASGHVNGLVGQDPYQMGVQAINLLYKNPPPSEDSIYGTAFMEMVRVPIELPPPNVNCNHLGNLRFLGISLFAVIAVLAISFAAWTCRMSGVRVVVASQPQFLLLICLGALVCGSALIPLSLDDSDPSFDGTRADRACQSVPWLASVGFTLMFSALFSKTWRINQIFRNPFPNARLKILPRDLYLPLFGLLGANIFCLTCWTIWDPVQYVRKAHPGTDEWNRVISTYGVCEVQSKAFGFILVAINLSAVIIANWQAYEARHIQSEFSESKYIALSMVCLLQAVLTAVPMLFLTMELPLVHYVVSCMTVSVCCLSIILLIFVPKISAAQNEKARLKESAANHLQQTIQAKMEVRFRFGSLIVQDDSMKDGSELSDDDEVSREALSNRVSNGTSSNQGSFRRRTAVDDSEGLALKRYQWSTESTEGHPHLQESYRSSNRSQTS